MGLTCWNGATCTRDCIKPCRPPVTLPGTVDFRRLLKLYMAHVLHEEGVTYVRDLWTEDSLTAAESTAISEIDAEVKKENPHDYLG